MRTGVTSYVQGLRHTYRGYLRHTYRGYVMRTGVTSCVQGLRHTYSGYVITYRDYVMRTGVTSLRTGVTSYVHRLRHPYRSRSSGYVKHSGIGHAYSKRVYVCMYAMHTRARYVQAYMRYEKGGSKTSNFNACTIYRAPSLVTNIVQRGIRHLPIDLPLA